MASQNYKLLIEAQLNTKGIQTQLSSIKNKIEIGFNYNKKDLDALYTKLAQIEAEGGKISRIRLFEGEGGAIGKAVVTYTNQVGNLVTATEKLDPKLKITQQRTLDLTTGFEKLTKGMMSSIRMTAEYALSIGLLYGALNQLKQGIQYVIDLNKEMTNIQLVTGQTDAQIAKLAVGYNDLAKEMAVSTLEIAKGSLEFVRQGKSAEDTAILIKNSTMMAKLGNLDAAESTERLTAIMNGFKLSATETGSVVDKLVGLDNQFATSVDEISTAMKYSSNSAQEAGVDFNHLAAYITVISSTTRQSSETIGQAMKTILARFTDIKAGRIDEDGLGINNVDDALKRVGVSLRDANGNFRDMQDVISDLGSRWSTIDDMEQKNIAKAVAGVRQKEQFLALMSHQLEVQKAIAIEDESANLRNERYAIYLKGIEAAQNRVIASWQELASGAATKDLIVGILNATTNVLEFINAIGGIPTVLKVVIPLLIAFNLELIKTKTIAFTSSIQGIISSIRLLGIQFADTIALMQAGVPVEEAVAAGFNGISASAILAQASVLAFVAALYLGLKAINDVAVAETEKRDNIKSATDEIISSSKSYDEYIAKTKEAAEANGYLYDENGKMYHEGYHGAKIYTEGMQLLTQAQWEAKKAVDATSKSISDQANVGSSGYSPFMVSEESKKALDEIHKKVIEMIKDEKKMEKEAIQAELSNFKNVIDQKKQYYKDILDKEKEIIDEKKTSLEREREDNNNLIEQQKEEIQNQLDGYKSLIDAQEELLREKQKETEYQRGKEEKEKALADLENQITILSLDNSAEALAEKLRLQEQASKLQTEISNDASDHENQLQIDALEKEKKAYEESQKLKLQALEDTKNISDQEYNIRLRDLEDQKKAAEQAYDITIKELDNEYAAREAALNAKIAQIDYYLQREGTISSDAMNMILDKNSNVYKQLLDWNKVYGTGINDDITNAWKLATDAINNYKYAASGVSVSTPQSTTGSGPQYPYYVNPNIGHPGRHSGVDSGFVGVTPVLKSNEEFAKLLKGEIVVNPSQMDKFMTKTLPSLVSPSVSNTMNGGNIEISMPLQVMGNLDKSTLPNIEKIVNDAVKKLNDNLINRGYNRRADQFSI